MNHAFIKVAIAFLGISIFSTSCVSQKNDVSYPLPVSIDDAQVGGEFVLAGPDTKSVIIRGKKGKYRFPFFGGDFLLARNLWLITGINVPIISYENYIKDPKRQQKYTNRIWVGRQPEVDKVLGEEIEKLDADGFIIKGIGNDLYITGKTKYGTHFAPYELLERVAGCRWYMPSPPIWDPKKFKRGLGDVIPHLKKVVAPRNIDIVENPSYKSRYYRPVPVHSFKLHRRDHFHHNLVNIIPPSKYGKTHPEYFPLINGKRFVPPENRKYDSQPCISNPDVQKLVIDAAKTYFKTNPEESCYSLGMNDSGKYCQCENCQKLSDKFRVPAGTSQTVTKHMRNAYAFFRFYNQVAEEIEKDYPDKRLGCLAYAVLSSLPKGAIKLHPKIVPYLTRDSAQLFDKSKLEAVSFLKSQSARGGTDLRPAVNAAYRYSNPDRQLNIVVLSDGMTEQGTRSELIKIIRSRPGNARVFCIGVGNEVNRPLLKQIARDAGGLASFISRGDNFSRQAKAFRRKLMRPAISNLKIEFSDYVYDTEPKQLPNLFHGQPLRIYGRYKDGGKVKVSFSGDIGSREYRKTTTLELPKLDEKNPEIERMWAWHKTQRLLEHTDKSGSRDAVIDEIVRLGEAYSIVTQYTSFLVLENDSEYRRWKINRVNALRIKKDRRSRQLVKAQFEKIRKKAATDIGPGVARKVTQARRVAQRITTPTPMSQTRSMPVNTSNSHRSFDIDLARGGGGGALDPFTAILALLGGIAACGLLKKKSNQ